MQFFWLCTGLFSVVAGFGFVSMLLVSNSAPQQAAGAAVALCVAVIPYVFTRAIEGWQAATWRAEVLAELKRQGQTTSPGVAAFTAAAAQHRR